VAHFDSLTIFFPMWNEEESIRVAVDAARHTCAELERDGIIGSHQVLIINDASTDDTGRIADELAASMPNVRVVHHDRNRRLGGALKTGFSEARGELILYTDADLPFDLAEVRKACRLLRIYRADIVSAYRHDRTMEGPRRSIYSLGYNLLLRLLFRLHLRDANFAFKLVRRRIFEHVRLVSEGSFIDAELLVRASRLGYRTLQFGVDYFPRFRGASTLSSLRVIARILRELAGLWLQLRRVRPLAPEQLALPVEAT
jgi:glycosyltransferase involved in cell wall biosynthesis